MTDPAPASKPSAADLAAARAFVERATTVQVDTAQAERFVTHLRKVKLDCDLARSLVHQASATATGSTAPELQLVAADLTACERLLGRSAEAADSGSDYAKRVVGLARRADAGGSLPYVQYAKTVKGVISLRVKADRNGLSGIGAMAKAINSAVGTSTVGKLGEAVADTLSEAYTRGLADKGVASTLKAMGRELASSFGQSLTSADDWKKLTAKGLGDAPGASRALKALQVIDRFAGPAGVVIDAAGVGLSIKDMSDNGLKASNGLGLASGLTGLGALGLATLGSGPAAPVTLVVGLGSFALGGGSLFAKSKENAAEARKAKEAVAEKLRRNPNTTAVLRGEAPPPREWPGGKPPSPYPQLSARPPLPPMPADPIDLSGLPQLSPTPPAAPARP